MPAGPPRRPSTGSGWWINWKPSTGRFWRSDEEGRPSRPIPGGTGCRLLSYEPKRIILFGSRARGEADEYSDYDIILIKRTPLPFLERLREVVPFLAGFECAVEVLIYTPEEFDQMQETGIGWIAHREGVTLYERGSN